LRKRAFALVAFLVLVSLALVLARLHSAAPASAVRGAGVGAEAAGSLSTVTATSTQQFSGQVTDTACGSTDFVTDPASTINVTITADEPTNDIMANLIYNGQIVHSEDTGVGQETFVYSVGELAGGVYTVQVCKSGNPATPFLPAGHAVPAAG
jgi:hypothetical protein